MFIIKTPFIRVSRGKNLIFNMIKDYTIYYIILSLTSNIMSSLLIFYYLVVLLILESIIEYKIQHYKNRI